MRRASLVGDVEDARCLSRWAQAIVCVEEQTQELGGEGEVYDFWLSQLAAERRLCLRVQEVYVKKQLSGLVEELRDAGTTATALEVEESLWGCGICGHVWRTQM